MNKEEFTAFLHTNNEQLEFDLCLNSFCDMVLSFCFQIYVEIFVTPKPVGLDRYIRS